MAKLNILVGANANDKAGDTLRNAFIKVNENFTELYTLTGGASTALTELAQDYAAPLFNHASHTNITATYDDANNKILLTGSAAQVQSNWTATTGLGVILNKPTLFSGSYTDLTNKPSIPTSFSSLVNSTKTVSLASTGVLSLPGSLTFSDDESTIRAFDPAVDLISGLSVYGKNQTLIGAQGDTYSFSWKFGLKTSNSTLTPAIRFPGSGWLQEDFTDIANQNVPLQLGSRGSITLTTTLAGYTNTEYNWVFGRNGSLTFPNATVQTTAWTGSVAYSSVTGTPTIPTSFSSLVNSTKTVSLASTGILSLPAQAVPLTTVSQITSATINRTGASTDTEAIAAAQDSWFGAEQTWVDLRDQDAATIAPATRTWAGLPSWEAYPLILAYTSGGGTGVSSFPSTTNAAKNAYLAYKELASNIDIVSGDKVFSFENSGALRVPGVITKDNSLILQSSGVSGVLPTGNSASINPNGNLGRVFIRTDNGTTLRTWEFDINGVLTLPGNLKFPDLTVQTTAWTGSVSSLVNGTRTVSLDSNSNLTFTNGEQIKTNFLGGGIELYQSSDNTIGIYPGGAEIKTFITGGPKYKWLFGITGNTTFPTGLVLGAPRGVNTVNFTCSVDKEFQIETGTASAGRLWQFGTAGNTTFPSGLTLHRLSTPYSNITADLDKILQIATQTSGGRKEWTFGTNGNLTAPGNLQVEGGKLILNTGGNAYVESVDYGVNSANSALNIFGGPYQKINLRAGFGTESTWTLRTNGQMIFPQGTGLFELISGPTNTFGIFANEVVGRTVTIRTSPLSGINKDYVFGADGTLTFPDYTVQSTAYIAPTTGNNVISSMGPLTISRNGMTIRVTSAGMIQMSFDSVINITGRSSINNADSVVISSPNGVTTAGTQYNIGAVLALGDHLTATIVDHDYHRIYRLTVIIRSKDTTPGLELVVAYAIIEQIQ